MLGDYPLLEAPHFLQPYADVAFLEGLDAEADTLVLVQGDRGKRPENPPLVNGNDFSHVPLLTMCPMPCPAHSSILASKRPAA
jgi:hypothetical protein